MNPSTRALDLDVPQPALPLARYRVRFREQAPEGAWPLASPRAGYLGSAWRGAFGHALRKTVCVTRLPACDPCMLLRSCPYPFLFESRTPPGAAKLTRYPRTPGPFVLDPADPRFDSGAENGTLNLGVTLFGSANDHLPYVVHALDNAGRYGLTARRVTLELLDVQVESRGSEAGFGSGLGSGGGADAGAGGDARTGTRAEASAARGGWTTIFEPGGHLSPVPAEPPAPPAAAPPAVRVRLLSPLRIKRRDHLVGAADFDFRAFMSALLRRVSMLTYFFSDTPLETDFAGLLRAAESVPVTRPELRWREWTRHSSRQNAKLQMGGLVGRFELAAPRIGPFWPLLWLGQWTHAGKGGSMGLGRYVLEPAPSAPDRTGEEQGAAASAPASAPAPTSAPNPEPWPAPSRL